MQSDDPPFLSVGTEVSAKFKGAFCEAKVKRMTKSVKCKVLLKTPPYGTIFADHTEIKGSLEVNQQVEIVQGKATYEGVIQNIKDNSIYVVVFNDGDERQLRRTQVCIKGAKHFDEDVNLDAMPLYKPESFSSPVVPDDRKGKQKRKNLEQSKQQRQQSTSASVGDKDDGREHDDDTTTSEDGSTLESTTSSTTLSHTSNSISETVTVPAQSGHKLRTRQIASKSVPRRLRSARRGFTSFYKPTENSSDLKSGDDEDDDNTNDDDGNDSSNSKMRRFARLPKPSVSRMIADKILTKSIARTRRKRYAAAVATDALKRIKEPNSTGSKRRLGDDDSYDKDDENSIIDEDYGGGDGDNDNDHGDNDDDDEVDDTDKEKGRTHARKKHCSSDDNDDDKSHTSDKMISSSNTSRKSERKRQRLRDKEVEPMTKKRSKDIDEAKKLYKVGSVVAVYEDAARRGKWTPAVVVAEVSFKASTKGTISIGKNDVLLRSFKDSKYFACPVNKLSSPGTSILRFPDSSPKAAMDRAVAFVEKEIFPAGWERSQIYDDMRPKKRERRSSSIDKKKRSESSGKAKREMEKKISAESSSSESESSTDEEYGEERDQFTAQLYKFHEERGTPINRAPILGGKDIDMFRLYNVVQRYGGKKRVIENNQWKLVLRKMHLEGCPGATSVTVKNAYSRYLDHFNSFYRNLGISSWLSTPTPSTSSRSERPNRLLDRHNIQLQRRKWALLASKKKEKRQKESASKGKITKREKDEGLPRTRRERIKKDERNMMKSDISEDDDKIKGAPSTSSQSSTPLLCLSPGGKTKSKAKDDEEQDKGSVSDSGTIESTKEKGSSKTEKESSRIKHRSLKKRDNERDTNKDEQQLSSKASDIDKKIKISKINKSEKKPSSDSYIKRKSPSIVSTASYVDLGVNGSDDEAHIRQMRLKEGRKLVAAGTRLSTDQKELSISKNEGSATGKDSDISQALRKEKTKEGVPWLNCSAATVLTNFYMGQNVKAYHHGQWYDARVITVGKISHGDVLSSMMDFEARCKAINESMDCDEKERKESLTRASARLNDRLEGILREMTCCVHYLGWNSRYDEWVELIKIKVHEKDQKLSEEQFLSIASDKLSAPTLEAAVAWRSSVDPAKLLATEVCSSGMRPRRLSHTHEHAIHPEVHSRSTTFSEKKVKKAKVSLTTSDSTVLKTPDDSVKQSTVHLASTNRLAESDAEIVLNRLPEEASVSETPPHLSFASELISSTVFLTGDTAEEKLPESNSKRRRTMSDNRSSVADLSDNSTKTPFIFPEAADNIKTEVEAGRVLVLDGESRTGQICVDKMRLKVPDENHDKSTVLEAAKVVEKKEQHTNGSEEQAKLMVLTKSNEINLKDDIDSKQKGITAVQQISPAGDPIQKITSSCKEISLELEATAEDIASKECDDEVWHPPMSLGLKQRGRGMKKKKVGRNASNTLVERKGIGKGGFKQINSEERSKESEECSSSDDESLPNVRDSWHALKVRMQQKVESEGAMAYAEKELNLEPIDENLTGEALINSYQERMQELRDIYHSIRADQARLDRRWRKTLEKRKQRDKEHRKKDEPFVQSPVGDNVV